MGRRFPRTNPEQVLTLVPLVTRGVGLTASKLLIGNAVMALRPDDRAGILVDLNPTDPETGPSTDSLPLDDDGVI